MNRVFVAFAVLLGSAPVGGQPARRLATPVDTAFASAVERLSEPGGFFDSDNLISNETSYLHVATRLEALGVRGGAYIGVGPDQNFSYLSIIRPSVAYLIDIRRDNMLQHLLFKALFTASSNRLEYLCRWLGHVPPQNLAAWNDRSIEDLVRYLETAPVDPAWERRVLGETMATIESFGVALDARDREVIGRFHREFMARGLGLRFSSFGRGNDPSYPTLRQLIMERDLDGGRRSYLARERDWQFVREMQVTGRVIPVVGNLAGTRAFPAVAAEVRRRRLVTSALYSSNAELYIWRDGGFETFASTVGQLPIDDRSVIIRSMFDRSGSGHPLAVPGHVSVQLLQRIADFTRRQRAGAFRTYRDVITLEAR